MSRRPEPRWRRILLVAGGILCLWGGAFQVQGLDPAKALHQYNCRAWTFQNGLPVISVQAVTQARDGCLWLGTRRGLLSYDGVQFSLAGLPAASTLRSTRVQALQPARNGGVWFGLNRSSYGLRGVSGQWRLGRDPQHDVDWDVPCLLEARDGTLWVGGEWAARGSAETLELTRLFPDGPNASETPVVISMLEDSKGRVWLGTIRHGLHCWQGGQLTKVQDLRLDSRIIRALAEDQSGQLWVGTHVGLLGYDANLRPITNPLPEYEVRCLLTDRNGALWVGTTGYGLARIQNGGIETLTKADGLTANTILALAEDAEGNIWIGTPEGLNQLTDIKLQTFAADDGLPLNSALSVSVSPRGGLWIGTDQGAVYWNGGQATVFSTTNGLVSSYVKRVLEATNGDVFVISGQNRIEILSAGTTVARHDTPGMPVAMTEDAKGVVVSVAGELFRVSREGLTPYLFQSTNKPALYWVVNLIPGRDGALWVASVNGVCRIKDGEFRQWTQQDGLTDSSVHWVQEEADGTVWIGLATGIARMKDGRIDNLRQSDGLLDANIYSITPDGRGWLWVDSLGGIYCLNERNVDQFIKGKTTRLECRAYDSPEAVKPGDKQSQEATACRTPDGRIWFPGPRGVVLVDPANLPVNRVAPPVRLNSVRAAGVDLDRSKPIVLRPGQRDLEFSYTAFTYTAPQQVRFRYRLEGHDAEWIEAGQRRLASYANLKPGRYTFRVTACNGDGIWNHTGDAVELELLPRFYQTGWFVVLAGLSLAGGLMGGYGWRVGRLHRKQRQLLEAQNLLEAKVIERTAELASSNASLRNEIEERRRMQLEIERVHEELVAASRAAGKAEIAVNVLHNVGNILNSVNVSSGLVSERVRQLRVGNLAKAAQLLEDHAANPGQFLITDPKGQQLPNYLRELAHYLSGEQEQITTELQTLADKVGHIKEIVAMQQAYARTAGILERVALAELIESALKMQADSLGRRGVAVVREFEDLPPVIVDKHKALQILVNLVRNAGQACEESGLPGRRLTMRLVKGGESRIRIEVADNGVGITPENLTRIFQHGFTTRKGGHGFGLHSAALAAGEMGGTLSAHSAGPGGGAVFTLELPAAPAPASATIDPDQRPTTATP